MNRREFLKLTTLALASLKGKPTMLPNQNQRYGDMLQELLSPLNVDPSKLDNLQKSLNDLWDRESVYRLWLKRSDKRIDKSVLDLAIAPIYTHVLESNKSSLVIPISGDFKHLFIMGMGRNTSSPATAQALTVNFRFNEDSTSGNYYWATIFLTGTAPTGANAGTAASLPLGYFNSSNCPSDTSSGFFAIIPHYTSLFYKTGLSFLSGERTANAGSPPDAALVTGFWKGTAPIQSLTVFDGGGGDLAAGSAISVYGLF